MVFGISKHRLQSVIKTMGVNAMLTDVLTEADVLVTAKSYYRQRPRIVSDAEQANVPIYVLRSNSGAQMETCLADLFSLTEDDREPLEAALREADVAIARILSGEKNMDLTPQNAFIRRRQHERVRESNLVSHSYGKEPMRHVRLFRQ